MASDFMTFINENILDIFGVRLTPQTKKAANALFMGTIAIMILLATWWGYSYFAGQKEKEAQKSLASCIELYDQASGSAETSIPWSSVESACKRAYDEHSRSKLAPYFLGYQAEALIKQNKLDEALAVMGHALQSMATSSPLYNLYATKLALMEMDSAESARQAQGLKRLEELAVDAKNQQRDEALYYLGLYYWHANDVVKAKEAWQTLAEFSSSSQVPSVWMQLVSDRLALLA